MKIEGNVATFTANLVSETSYSATSLGRHDCTMEFFQPRRNEGFIEWVYGEEDVVEIGLWFDSAKNLIDYDGVFELPKEAIALLESLGYNCDDVKNY